MAAVDATDTNGVVNGSAEDDKNAYRPPDIDADVKEMERRKRVEAIMGSKIFREELEKIIEQQMREGGPGTGTLLQQISDIMGTTNSWRGNGFRGGSCAIPINDIRGIDTIAYAKGEKVMRCKLAAVYRLVDLYGWSQNIYNHITLRVSHDEAHFLINPFGMLYNEMTASSLVKVDLQGNVVEPGTTNLGVNIAGFTLHSAIHAHRPDLKCIIHLHLPTVIAISSLKCGLLPLSQEAAIVGDVSYHEYQGILVDPAEKDLIIRNLGPFNKVMFLRNHGVVCCGESVEEAFMNTYLTVLACETQMKLMPLGLDNVIVMSDEARKRAFETAHSGGGGGVNSKEEGVISTAEGKPEGKKERKWRFGEQEFEALMRSLDNAGYRTGYIYRQPLIRNDMPRPKYDVELPPAVSSLGYLIEEEELYKNNPNWKKFMEGRKGFEKTRWLNSPNVYQKVEVLETGTPDPKKITKWVADGSPGSNTAVRIDHMLQFVPKGTDPKEFKKLQQQIKENRRAGGISAGPQSQILEGVTWDEARQCQEATLSGTGDQVILVGAASKGIIQRDFQHHAVVYKTPYAKNPFDCVTNEEIEAYKQGIERKQRGDDSQDETTPIVSPVEDSRDANDLPEPFVSRSKSARFPRELEAKLRQRRWSGSEKNPKPGEAAVNGEEHDISTEDSSSKAEKKKKKKGLKTPSFLKKKKEKKKTDS
ncbi:protein hu-li tai shao isoform X3 [Folsomia candida]|uniref:protein hu-li tai shao isoform X3 n=1 Tax=Folsomia candida TaxID=158441 RepID=UPI000B903890|nr:protein hu-li tai shao isoform X3 [Folsomia candida]